MHTSFIMEETQENQVTSQNGPRHYLKYHLVARAGKYPTAAQETLVRSLGWEDLQEKGLETYPSILAWRIPWTEEPGSLQSVGLQKVRQG